MLKLIRIWSDCSEWWAARDNWQFFINLLTFNSLKFSQSNSFDSVFFFIKGDEMWEEGAVQAVLRQETRRGRRGRDVQHPVQVPKGNDVSQTPHRPGNRLWTKLQILAHCETGKRSHLLCLLRSLKINNVHYTTWLKKRYKANKSGWIAVGQTLSRHIVWSEPRPLRHSCHRRLIVPWGQGDTLWIERVEHNVSCLFVSWILLFMPKTLQYFQCFLSLFIILY